MKSLLTLHTSTLRNLGQICSVNVARDLKTVTDRHLDEGDGFLTIVLPGFAKALERALRDGSWPAQDMRPTWSHVRGLPAFMRGFLSRIFAPDGTILETPDVDCIWAVRQFCYLTHKVKRKCSAERTRRAFASFVSTDAELAGLQERISPARLLAYVRTSDELFGEMFDALDSKVAAYELIPNHGPGSVADRLSQKEKRQYPYWTRRLDDVFPRWRYTVNVPKGTGPVGVPIVDELPVRVIDVPKTQSTPRIIALEPSAMQYAQQGLKREIYEWIGRDRWLNGILGFRAQTRNREMARRASITGDMSTLDLSEASDRVHWMLIYAMLHRWPHLRDFVFATRSWRADVPGHGVITMNKFASMGSALTFPLEAMVFTTLAVCGIVEPAGSTVPSAKRMVGRVSVYGDDIIVPTDATDRVIDWLEHFGARVNRSKSFWSGKFRESCGAEYYDGTDVSVVRVRSELPSSRDDAAAVAALVDLRNRAYRAGLWSLCSDIDRGLDTLITSVPIASAVFAGEDGSGAAGYLHRFTFLPYYPQKVRYDPDLQRWVRRVPVLKPHTKKYRVDDEAGLLEWFHDSLRQKDLVDPFDSQERAPSFSIKRRWFDVTR